MESNAKLIELSPDIGLVEPRLSFLERHSRRWMTVLLCTADLFSLSLAGIVAILIRALVGGRFETLDFYLRMLPLLVIFLGIYAWRGLYPSVGLSPIEEIQRLSVSTSVVFLLATGFTFWIHGAERYSRPIFAMAWIFSLVLVPLVRMLVRVVSIKFGVWGEPVAVVGYGQQGKKVIDYLCQNLHLGLRPVAVFPHSINQSYLDRNKLDQNFFEKKGIKTLVLITSETPEAFQDVVVDQQRFGFRRLILIPNLRWVGSVGVVPHDLEGYLGLEVRQNLLSVWQQTLKRILDVSIVFVSSIFVVPVSLFIALLIRLDSKGNILYSQERVGRDGKKFKMWKFRTMVENANEVLEKYLASHPDALDEWEYSQKLKKDPRVTRIGYLLRKSSLDEFPQLLNVLKGDMSLVGPRPFFVEQTSLYGKTYHLYKQVQPGITGLWQVSGRNDIGYDERVRYDEYYVRNWSVWLDIYILIRTGWVVIRGEGAY
jgi:Undecaprenyl-phosphate galactose phosphotransferase WbaP